MNRHTNHLSKIAFLFTHLALASSPIIERDAFPNSPKVIEWFDEISTLDLDSSEVTFKLGGSTSCNAHVYLADDKIGKFIPENPAGNPNTEVAYFNFGRMLGKANVFQRAVPYILGRSGAQKFKSMIDNGRVGGAQRANCRHISNKVSANGDSLEGAYKDKVGGDEIDVTDYYSSSGLNLNKKVSKFLKQSNSKPTDALMSLDSARVSAQYQGKERKLADQLFHILIADVLFGQYDRYSGSNFVVRVKPEDSSVEFFAKDNGGTYLIAGYTTRNLHALRDNWFNRYNKETMDTLTKLYKFLNGEVAEFEGFTDKLEFASALGLKFTRTNGADTGATSISAQLSTFKGNLEKLLQKYRSDVAAGGENAYY